MALRLALKNMVLMVEYKEINGENEFYVTTYPKVLGQAKLVLGLV
jgi:hypothetical protein